MRKILLFLLILVAGVAGCAKYNPVTKYEGAVPGGAGLAGKRIVVAAPYFLPDHDPEGQKRLMVDNITVPEKAQFRRMLVDALNKAGATAVLADDCGFYQDTDDGAAYDIAAKGRYDYIIEVGLEKPVVGKRTITEKKPRVASDIVKGVLTLGLNPTRGFTVTAHYNRDVLLRDVALKANVWGELSEAYAEDEITVVLDSTVYEKDITTEAQQKEIAALLVKLVTVLSGREG